MEHQLRSFRLLANVFWVNGVYRFNKIRLMDQEVLSTRDGERNYMMARKSGGALCVAVKICGNEAGSVLLCIQL